MQGDVLQGHLVEELEHGLPFVGALPPQTHLDGELKVAELGDALAEGLHDIEVGQHTAAAAMFGLQGEGAAHIEVDAGIAPGGEHIEQILELLHGLEDDLGHHRHSLIVLGSHIAQVLATHASALYPQEGGGIGGHAAHQLVMESAVGIVGIALQRREVEEHIKFIL